MSLVRVTLQGLVDPNTGDLISLIIPEAPGGRQFAIGGDGLGGASAFSELTDKATATIPSTNLPTAQALALLVPLTQKGAVNGVAGLDDTAKVPASQLPNSALTDSFAALTDKAGVDIPAINGPTAAAINARVLNTAKGAANGVATLDASTKIPVAQLPDAVVGGLNYKGTWNATTNTPALASGVGTKGFMYKVSVAGTTNLDGNNSWVVGDSAVFNGLTWDNIHGAADLVQSVAGRTGVVVLGVADVSGAAPLNSPALVTPNLGTPSAGNAANMTNVQLAALTGLAANIAAFLATPSSANLRTALTNKTGSGLTVFNTAPVLDTPSLTGIVTRDGASTLVTYATGALVIDVTKGMKVASIAANATFTFSGTPATADTWFSMLLTNTDTSPHIVTFPSSFSVATQGLRTTCPIPAGGKLNMLWHWDGTIYHVYGDGGFLNNFATSANPGATDDNTKGYGVGSYWGNTSSGAFYWCETAATGAAVWNAVGSQGVSGGASVVPLAVDHVLSASDDNTIFYVSAGILLTVPDGLNPKPSCGFLCPASGAITVRMSGGATHDGGLTADVVKTRSTDPAGFNVGPVDLPSDTSKHDYVIGAGLATYSTIGGAATDSASLVALFPQITKMSQYGLGGSGRNRVPLTSSLTLDPTQCVDGGLYPPGTTFRNIAAASRTITLPVSMPLNYWFEVRHDSATASITTGLAKQAGVSWNPRQVSGVSALKIASQGFSGIVRCYDTDAWEFVGSDWTV